MFRALYRRIRSLGKPADPLQTMENPQTLSSRAADHSPTFENTVTIPEYLSPLAGNDRKNHRTDSPSEPIPGGLGDRPKYQFREKCFSGGMGEIYRVLDRDLKRISAMKIALPELKNDPEALRNFINEARITGYLEHPNILPVHEFGTLKDRGPYFTMKLAQGDNLNTILAEIKNKNPAYVEKYTLFHLLNIFRKVCDAVAFAHSKDIIHLDIKPHNILVGRFGEVFLMDWGISRFIGDPAQVNNPDIRLFLTDLHARQARPRAGITGSPAYMSPEQATGALRHLDKRTDIFLLGATLFHIFTLSPPYSGNHFNEILAKAKTGEAAGIKPWHSGKGLPEEMCRIIQKAMNSKPENRYPEIDELIQDLDDHISGKCAVRQKKRFPPGKVLMREGEIGHEAYQILAGKVLVYRQVNGQKIFLSTLTPGHIVGEMSLITGEPRSAHVMAVESTEVAVVTEEVLAQNLKNLPPYIEKIVSTLTDRLRAANAIVHPHLTSDPTPVVLKQRGMIFKTRAAHQPDPIPFQELVEEISENLGLPHSKVSEILKETVEPVDK